jgi:hypothetical protein
MAARPTPAGCDPDAAYNPDGPCTPLAPAVVQTAAVTPAPVPYITEYCDPDAAYDPTRPCRMPPQIVAQSIEPPPVRVVTQAIEPPLPRPPAPYVAEARPIQERMGQRVAFSAVPLPPPLPPPSHWMIQVGAFATLTTAQAAAERARSVAPDLLRTAKVELPATAPLGTQVAFRARLSGLSATAAVDACGRLTSRGIACITVPPPHDSF